MRLVLNISSAFSCPQLEWFVIKLQFEIPQWQPFRELWTRTIKRHLISAINPFKWLLPSWRGGGVNAATPQLLIVVIYDNARSPWISRQKSSGGTSALDTLRRRQEGRTVGVEFVTAPVLFIPVPLWIIAWERHIFHRHSAIRTLFPLTVWVW